MRHRRFRNVETASFKCIISVSAWIIFLCGINFFHDSTAMMGLQTASAGMKYGIQGYQAPEMNLTTWIDGDGKQIEPVKLHNYRGRVIYLYFFQDW